MTKGVSGSARPIARRYLRDAFDTAIPESVGFPQSVDEDRVRLVGAMLERRIQTLKTSSCRRLFEAVASLIRMRSVVSFEGQAAMRLEAIAADDVRDGYEFAIVGERLAQLDMRPMVRQSVSDVVRDASAGVMAARPHNTLVSVVRVMCVRRREELSLARVCLSDGCFQNARLPHGSAEGLRTDGFEVLFHRVIPSNDGGISVREAAIACELVQRGL